MSDLRVVKVDRCGRKLCYNGGDPECRRYCATAVNTIDQVGKLRRLSS